MNKLTIVMYHYVRPIKKSSFPLIKGLEIKEFKNQIDYLNKNYQVISMENLIDHYKNNYFLPPKSCLLTFDDGFDDHYSYVFPELIKKKIKGSFFPPAKPIQENTILDVHKIQYILAQNTNTNQIIEEIKKLLKENYKETKNFNFNQYWKKYAKPNRFDDKKIIFIKRLLQHILPKKIRTKYCDILFQKFVSKDLNAFSQKIYMSKKKIKEMVSEQMYFGSHTYSHYWMDKISKNEQSKDIDKSLEFLKKIGASINDWVIAYPYGAYSSETIKILKKKKCYLGLTTKNDCAILSKKNMLTLSRMDTNDFPK